MTAASRTAAASTDLADAPRVSASDAKNSFGRILDRVAREGRVAITKHDEPCAMLISIDEYRSLVETGRRAVNTLSDEFDAVYERLQQPGAAAAMQKAFAMTPAELGRAASRPQSTGDAQDEHARRASAPRAAGKGARGGRG